MLKTTITKQNNPNLTSIATLCFGFECPAKGYDYVVMADEMHGKRSSIGGFMKK